MARDPELFWRITKAAAGAIAALQLPLTDRVYFQITPQLTTGLDVATGTLRDLVLPCVLLTAEGEAEELLRGESESVGYVWPLRCWVADSNPAERSDRARGYMTARKAILDCFHQQRLAGVPEVVQCLVTPGLVFDPRLPQYQAMVSGMLLKFEAHESRY